MRTNSCLPQDISMVQNRMQDHRLPGGFEYRNDFLLTENMLSLFTGRVTVASRERLCTWQLVTRTRGRLKARL